MSVFEKIELYLQLQKQFNQHSLLFHFLSGLTDNSDRSGVPFNSSHF